MSQQRKRHFNRQPIEESVRLEISSIVGGECFVEVEQHSYDWKADDLLVWIHIKNSMDNTALEALRQGLSEKMNNLLPAGKPLEWSVVVKRGGQSIATIEPNIAFNPDGSAAS